MTSDHERRAPEEEKRLLLLYIIGGVDRISDMQLLQLLFENDLMNYFDMMLTLGSLCAQGQCVRTPALEKNFYTLTAAGREALELFARILPASVREKLDALMPAWRERIRTEQEYPVSWRQTGRGEYLLEMGIAEQNMEMLHITLSLPTEEIARETGRAWTEKAGAVYRFLLDTLSGRPDAPSGQGSDK